MVKDTAPCISLIENNFVTLAAKVFAIDMKLYDNIECKQNSIARRREDIGPLSRLT